MIRGLADFRDSRALRNPSDTGREAAGRVPLFPGRRVSVMAAGSVTACLPAEALADPGRAIPSNEIPEIR
jgi:hypothetical protein